MTENQAKLVALEKQRKEIQEQYAKTLAAVGEEMKFPFGEPAYFQDDEGIVYKLVTPLGRWVAFDSIGLLRTKREGEKQGSLSVKEAREAGFEVE